MQTNAGVAVAKEPIQVRMLVVSSNVQTREFLCEQARQLPITVDTCDDSQAALKRLCRAKFEGVVVELELKDECLQLLQTLRELTWHRDAISFATAKTAEEAAEAFRSVANFVLQEPFVGSSVLRTFKAAYPMMFRERRRGYRHAIEAQTLVKLPSSEEFRTTSVNISETGMAINSSAVLRV